MPKKGEGKYIVNSMTKQQKVKLILWINENKPLMESTPVVECSAKVSEELGYTVAPYTLRTYAYDIFPGLKFPKPVYQRIMVRTDASGNIEESTGNTTEVEKPKAGQWVKLLYEMKKSLDQLKEEVAVMKNRIDDIESFTNQFK
jgi:hypothetical protein